MKDVRADDLRDREWIDQHHHEPEESAAANRCQADDEAENGADQDRTDLVFAREDERGVIRLDTALDERLRDESRRPEDERGADRIALGRLDTVAVRVRE